MKRKSNEIKIRCIETNKKYQSIKQAADDIGCSAPLISAHLKGKLNHAKQFHFEYDTSDFKMIENETEEIKDVVGYEGLYKVSRTGIVYNAKTGIEVMQSKQNEGYLVVNIRGKGKPRLMTVHRIVAMAFIENPDNLPCVNHKDENRQNNNADNLEWCTHKYNVNYGSCQIKHGMARGKKVVCIETGKIYYSIRDAARSTGLTKNGISKCAQGKYKHSGGLHWKFVEEMI